jgi:hypothetical protein
MSFWIRIRIANPDPDTDPGTPLNPDPFRIWIYNSAWKGLDSLAPDGSS